MTEGRGGVTDPVTARESDDLVVLLDDEGRPCGTAARDTVHGTDTPLHLAFSLHVLDEVGRTLLTRRALDKRTWPGVWTNSCCGHPRPGEDLADAVRRRTREELGLEVGPVELVLPDFAYRAVDASGVVEHERCPVFVTSVASGTPLDPDPREVCETAWVPWADVVASARRAPVLLSPWSTQQWHRMPPVWTDLPGGPR